MYVEVQMLQALHAHQRGDAESARRFLDELLPDIERTGMIRLLLDFAPLHDLVRTSLTPVAQRLSAHLPRITAPPPAPRCLHLQAKLRQAAHPHGLP
jgi:hypothetical protein